VVEGKCKSSRLRRPPASCSPCKRARNPCAVGLPGARDAPILVGMIGVGAAFACSSMTYPSMRTMAKASPVPRNTQRRIGPLRRTGQTSLRCSTRRRSGSAPDPAWRAQPVLAAHRIHLHPTTSPQSLTQVQVHTSYLQSGRRRCTRLHVARAFPHDRSRRPTSPQDDGGARYLLPRLEPLERAKNWAGIGKARDAHLYRLRFAGARSSTAGATSTAAVVFVGHNLACKVSATAWLEMLVTLTDCFTLPLLTWPKADTAGFHHHGLIDNLRQVDSAGTLIRKH